jgi:gliding motility-associated-like protein
MAFRLIIFFFGFSFSVLCLKSQTSISINQTNSSAEGLQLKENDSKLNFIKKQNYLSKSTLRDFKNSFGDSLKGFEESKIKVGLLAKGLQINEALGYLETLKRQFIKDKYRLSESLITIQSNNQGNNSETGTFNHSKQIGGGAIINVSPCINEGFESSPIGSYIGPTNSLAVNGWTLSSRNSNGVCPYTTWNNGATEFSIVSTPIINFPVIGTIPNSPLGGTVVARINNSSSNASVNRMTQSFPVTNANALFQFAYCGYWQDGGNGHSCCDQPGVYFKMYSCSGTPLACSSLSLAPGSGCQSSGTNYTVIPNTASWTNWQVKYIDLTPYIGTCITIEVYTADCAFGGHYGTTFFDCLCGGQLLCPTCGLPGTGGGPIAGPVSFCAGSGIAQINAPLGYSSYQWIAPGPSTIAAPMGTMSAITLTNPIPGSVYTVNLVSPSGCQFVSTNTIVFTQVNVSGLGSSSTCINGASGSATVIGNGSGTGYNYTWLNSTSSVIGTSSVVNNLAAGVYSIILSGLGASGCGSAVATTTINNAPQGVTPIFKPFCGSSAFLSTSGGSNYKWYNNLSLITGTAGMVSTYTVFPAVNNSVYHLSYLSNQGCQDSIKFTLISSPPGLLSISNIGLLCPGANNGTAAISMTPAVGSPPGLNLYNVINTSLTPSYSFSLGYTGQNTFSLGGLSSGSYSVSAFDGSCTYSTTFNVNPFTFNYSVSPVTASLCPGNFIAAGVSFTSPANNSQFTYSWSPNIFLSGNVNTLQNTIIAPSTNPGTNSTTIYTIVVTPTAVNCPLTKTISITAISPPLPTITAIPNLCDNALPHQIIVSPLNGTFISTFSGTNNPISNSGLLFPNSSGLSLGTNSFTYAINVGTCQSAQNATFEISHFNPSALTSSIAPLCVTNPPLNLMNIVLSSANGTWSSSQGVVNNQFIPFGLTTNTYNLFYNTTSNPNPTVCPSTSNLIVSVTNTVTPNIATSAEFCTNSPSFSLVASPPGGTWGGNPAVSVLGVVTPSFASPSSPNVSYSVTIGPCTNIASTILQVSQFNTAAFRAAIPALCYNSNPFPLLNVVQSTVNGTWFGHSSILSNSFLPSGLITNTYVLSYSTTSSPNPTLCPDSRTITASVYNPPIPNITMVGPFCSKDEAIQLNVNSVIGNWTPTSYLNNLGVFTPSLCSIGFNPIQYVIGTNTCFTQATRLINVEAFASAAILSKIPDQCNSNSPINLSPFTQNASGIWNGAGITGTSFNPANTGAGRFVLTYNTSSSPSGLCPDQSTIAVNVFSLASPVLNQQPTVCNNSKPIQIIVSPLGGIFGGSNNSGISNKGLFNPAAGIIGNNVINYSITSGPCVAYAQTTVSVVKFVSADLAKYPKEVYCQGLDEPINLDGLAVNPGGVWTGNGVSGKNMFNPKLANVGLNTITYSTNSIPTTSLCPDVKSFNIKVGAAVIVNVSTNLPNGEGCSPLQVVFYPQTNVGKGSWDFGDGSEVKTDALNVSHVYTAPGSYTAIFNYIGADGCPANPLNVNPIITVHEAPVVNFSIPDEVFISNPEVQLTNLSSMLNTNKYVWTIENLYTLHDEVNPKIPFPKAGKYLITLNAQSAKSCTNEISKTIEVKNDFNIFIPSSFTPNFDGLNDTFIPVFSNYGLDPKSFEMEIFDRWGHSLFRSKDVNKGWDGSVQNKGEQLKEEVYVYKIKYKDVEGNLYNKMGHVTLLK